MQIKWFKIEKYIQTGSLKTVSQNGVPSRNPQFCVVSGHGFSENLRGTEPSESQAFFIFLSQTQWRSDFKVVCDFRGVRRVFFVRCCSLQTQMIFFGG